MEYFNLVNSHDYFYLNNITEPNDNSVRVIIRTAELTDNQAQIEIGESHIENVRAIESSKSSPNYEIVFSSYVGYSVRDESFAYGCNEKILQGKLFCIYEDSEYLNYIKKCTMACDDHPGPITHYGINCLNHIIDIISTDEPIIKLLPG